MWRTIQEVKGKHSGHGIIVGTGPTADDLGHLRRDYPRSTLIGVNRAICLNKQFDFIFVDHAQTLNTISKFIENTQHICMPIFSRADLNINSSITQRFQHKILLFAWVYENWQILNGVDYPLNDLLLYISWGCVQSALHFSKLIGLSRVTLIGVDGGPAEGKICSQKIADTFNHIPNIKQQQQHKQAASKLVEISREIGITLEKWKG